MANAATFQLRVVLGGLDVSSSVAESGFVVSARRNAARTGHPTR